MGAIAKRYAKALLLYAEECHASSVVYQQMKALQHTLMQVPQLKKALDNPVLAKDEKKSLIEKAVGKEMHPVLQDFFNLIMDHKRENQLTFIVYSFIELYRNSKDIVKGKLTTAIPIPEQTEELFKEFVENASKKRVEFDVEVDKEILGGFILQIASMRMDASVSNQLKQIKKQLCEQNK